MNENGINEEVEKFSHDINIVIDDVINETTCGDISSSKKKMIKHNIIFFN